MQFNNCLRINMKKIHRNTQKEKLFLTREVRLDNITFVVGP